MLHNPQALLFRGKLVKIRKRRCQVGSEFATFFDFFWREDEPWVVLRLSTGRRITMPASWTDLPRSAFLLSRGTQCRSRPAPDRHLVSAGPQPRSGPNLG